MFYQNLLKIRSTLKAHFYYIVLIPLFYIVMDTSES